MRCFLNVGGAMHFIYYINRLTATKVDSTYMGCLTNNTQRIIMSVAGLKRMTTGSAVSALSYHATQVEHRWKQLWCVLIYCAVFSTIVLYFNQLFYILNNFRPTVIWIAVLCVKHLYMFEPVVLYSRKKWYSFLNKEVVWCSKLPTLTTKITRKENILANNNNVWFHNETAICLLAAILMELYDYNVWILIKYNVNQWKTTKLSPTIDKQ